MSEALDSVEGLLATEIAPPTQPRDTAGKLIRESANPEPMFQERRVEGDPYTGDTRDGGDDPALAAREREIADGYEEGRSQADERRRRADAQRRANAAADDELDVPDSEPENLSAESEPDTAVDDVAEDEDGSARYEVVVDGKKHEVSLNEALNGYIRQATFHQRMNQLQDAARAVEDDYNRLQQYWGWWDREQRNYEEDLTNLTPPEPDWDQEFARDPAQAHAKQKVFQIIYGKLAASRNARAQRDAFEAQDQDRRVQKYAVDGFSKFVMDHIKVMPDEPTLRKNIQSMRRTAAAVGFNDYEVATVYDPRMLTVLWKASKYDRMTAAAPRAVVAGKGRALAPGAATPLRGNARRSGYEDAQRQLARSGKISDAAEFFRFVT